MLKDALVCGGAQKLEALLLQWDSAQGALALARAEQAKYEALGRASGAKRAPTVRAGCCGCLRPRIDAVEHFNRQVCCLLASARVTNWLCLCGWCATRAHWLLWLPARNARVHSSHLNNSGRVRVPCLLAHFGAEVTSAHHARWCLGTRSLFPGGFYDPSRCHEYDFPCVCWCVAGGPRSEGYCAA